MQNPITKYRENAGLTRLELAQMAGLSRNTIASYEVGGPSHMGPISALNLSRVLDVPADELQALYTAWRLRQGKDTNTMTALQFSQKAQFAGMKTGHDKPVYIIKDGKKIAVDIEFRPENDGLRLIIDEQGQVETRTNIQQIMDSHGLK